MNIVGYRKIWHSGGIVAYQSQLWLFPDKKSGVFVVISGPYTSQGSLAIKVSSAFFFSRPTAQTCMRTFAHTFKFSVDSCHDFKR